jgi:hypothetical protein
MSHASKTWTPQQFIDYAMSIYEASGYWPRARYRVHDPGGDHEELTSLHLAEMALESRNQSQRNQWAKDLAKGYDGPTASDARDSYQQAIDAGEVYDPSGVEDGHVEQCLPDGPS